MRPLPRAWIRGCGGRFPASSLRRTAIHTCMHTYACEPGLVSPLLRARAGAPELYLRVLPANNIPRAPKLGLIVVLLLVVIVIMLLILILI